VLAERIPVVCRQLLRTIRIDRRGCRSVASGTYDSLALNERCRGEVAGGLLPGGPKVARATT